MRLRSIRTQANDPTLTIDFTPCEIQNLMFPPAGVIGEIQDILVRSRKVLPNL